MSMTRQEAIKKFEAQLRSAGAVLDSGFGTRPGESDRLYRERKEMAEIALQALQEQEERENRNPLTIAELVKMQDQAVWVEPKGDRLLGFWGVVEGASEYDGKKYLYLHGNPFCHILEEDYIAYRHKPKGVQK